MTGEVGVYVARYGWNRRSGTLIIGAGVFVAIALTAPMSLALRVITLVFFGGGLLVFVAGIASRRVALRVDASGVTLGGSPGRYRSTTVLIPWADIRQIVLWRQPMPYGRSMRYIGVAAAKAPRRWPAAGASVPASEQPARSPQVSAAARCWPAARSTCGTWIRTAWPPRLRTSHPASTSSTRTPGPQADPSPTGPRASAGLGECFHCFPENVPADAVPCQVWSDGTWIDGFLLEWRQGAGGRRKGLVNTGIGSAVASL